MLFRTEEDYADLAEDYLLSLSRQDAIYSECFISTDHAISAGLSTRAPTSMVSRKGCAGPKARPASNAG